MRRLVAVSALLISVLLATGCEARGRNTQNPNVANRRPVYCTVLADSPRRDAEPARKIVARARFRCDRPGAETMVLTLRLEKRLSSRWSVLQTQTFTMRGQQTHNEFFKYHNRQVSIECSTGRYRTSVEWFRQSRGNKNGGTTRSGQVVDPCTPRLFSPR